jgi:hypothetical protein
MTEDDFLRRFDRHLEIGSDHLARGSELLALGNVLHERSNELMSDNKAALASLGRAMQDVGIELRLMSERGERVAREMVAAMQDLGAESRAQQQALFVVIDRLTGDGPTPGDA